MSVPRRSSNNPFSESLSPNSTGSTTMTNNITTSPPLYPPESSNNQYYNSDEKSRPSHREAAPNADLPPPSYEEAAGPKVVKGSHPREKSSSSSSRPHRSQSDSERHRTRVNREWPGDSNGEPRSHRHRSERDGERHRSDREHRSHREHHSHRSADKSRSSSTKHKNGSSKSKPKPKNVDTIDKLDVTGLFGGTFHHDGPFDACTPQRNKNQKSAPVLAFPVDGPNNSIKGKAISSKEATIDYVMGRDQINDDDLYTAAGTSASPPKQPLLSLNRENQSQSTIAAVKNTENITQFDANKTSTPVHGETTLGLGSSTFLDGAPAAKQTAFEEATQRANIGGISRKKSMKSKQKEAKAMNINNSGRSKLNYDEDEPIRFSPDKAETSGSSGGNSLLKRVRSLKVGRSKS